MPTDLTLTLPLSILGLAILVLLMVGAFTNSARLTGWLTAAAFIAAALPWLLQPYSAAVFVTSQGPLLHLSPFSILASLLALGTAALSLPLAPTFFNSKQHKPEYYVLVALATLGALVLINSSHFLSFYVGLELMSFPLYILAAFLRKDAASSEAGLKYFVLGSLASGLMLYGFSLLYAQTGTLGYAPMLSAIGAGAHNPLMLVALALACVGLVFKLSIVPFHMWTPDVYQGAPMPVTAFMASLPKLAATVALVRLLSGPFGPLAETWQPALAGLAGLGMLAGSTLAILQTDLKRLLAWSTVAQVGFLLTGVVAHSAAGAHAALFYIFIYGITMLGTFAALLALKAMQTTDLKGLAGRHPYAALGLLIYLFSMAGIPPLAGFFAKFTVFAAAVAAGYAWLAIVGVLCSAVAAFYSLWLVKLMYFDTPEKTTLPNVSPDVTFALLLAAALVVLGLFPGLLTTFTVAAATAIF